MKSNIEQIQEITKQFIAKGITFSIRHYFNDPTMGTFQTEIYTKDAVNAKLLFLTLFDIFQDVNKATVSKAIFTY